MLERTGLPRAKCETWAGSAPSGSLGRVQAWTEQAGFHRSRKTCGSGPVSVGAARQPFQGVWAGPGGLHRRLPSSSRGLPGLSSPGAGPGGQVGIQ